jgi:hypothetical protein
MQMEHIQWVRVKNNDCINELFAEKNIWNREIEAERYVTRIACWQQFVLGCWNKGCEEEGWDEIGSGIYDGVL